MEHFVNVYILFWAVKSLQDLQILQAFLIQMEGVDYIYKIDCNVYRVHY